MKPVAKMLWLNAVLGLATLLFLLAIGRNFYNKMGFEKNQPARSEMRVLLSRLQLGDSKPKVRSLVQAKGFKHLTLDTRPVTSWTIRTPHEFGAKNWVLFLEFDAPGNLAAIRLRTLDGSHIRPRDVKIPDRTRPNWISPRPDSWGSQKD